MKLTVNGKDIEFNGATVLDLVNFYKLKPEGIVVERNREIVHREGYEAEALVDGDVIEMVRVVGGG